MKETYLIQDTESQMFVHPEIADGNSKLGAREGVELLTQPQAERVASDLYGPDWRKRASIVEATASEYMQHLGRKGGCKRSRRKTKAARLNALQAKKKHRWHEEQHASAHS